MASRPKKAPKWIVEFFSHCEVKDGKDAGDYTGKIGKKMKRLIKQHWDSFYEEWAATKPPTKKRKVDPAKNIDVATDKLAEAFDSLDDITPESAGPLLDKLRTKVESLPEEVRNEFYAGALAGGAVAKKDDAGGASFEHKAAGFVQAFERAADAQERASEAEQRAHEHVKQVTAVIVEDAQKALKQAEEVREAFTEAISGIQPPESGREVQERFDELFAITAHLLDDSAKKAALAQK